MPVTSKAVPSILASSVCWSLQCLISALTQWGKGGHLSRLTCSVVLRGGRNTASKYHWRVWGALAVSGHTGFVPAHGVCAFPIYLLRLPFALQGNCLRRALGCVHFPGLSRSGSGSRVLHKAADSVGPAFCALPGLSSSGDQVLGEHTLPGSGVRLITSPVPDA